MSSVEDRRIPLSVLGGFLGAGKTTWLRHQLHQGKLTEALVIVNEAADVPVDDMLLFKSSNIRVLAGGCACCSGKENLLALLRQICDERVDSKFKGVRHQQVVLETSGLADPGSIVDAIRCDPVLTHHIIVRDIIVAVDALHGLEYLKSEPLGRLQVETADRLIITKADTATGDAVRVLRATLETVNPGADIVASAMGSETELASAQGVAPVRLPKIENGDARQVISTAIRLAEGADWTAFGLWLSALLHVRGNDMVRVKGVIRTPSGRLLLQSVRRVVQSPEILPDYITHGKDENCVVFIGRGFKPADLKTSLWRFAGLAVRENDSANRPEIRNRALSVAG